MTQLHNVIDKNQTRRKHERLIQASRRMYQLHKNINKEKPAEARLQEQEEYNEIQRELRMEAELKEKAKQGLTMENKFSVFDAAMEAYLNK
jgi:D-hexose-6-phosphate mutarotase